MLVHLSTDVAVAMAGEGARSEDIEFIRKQYGFDRPLAVQYADWLGRASRGDFGESLYFRTPVAGIVSERLPTTLLLGALAIASRSRSRSRSGCWRRCARTPGSTG